MTEETALQIVEALRGISIGLSCITGVLAAIAVAILLKR